MSVYRHPKTTQGLRTRCGAEADRRSMDGRCDDPEPLPRLKGDEVYRAGARADVKAHPATKAHASKPKGKDRRRTARRARQESQDG